MGFAKIANSADSKSHRDIPVYSELTRHGNHSLAISGGVTLATGDVRLALPALPVHRYVGLAGCVSACCADSLMLSCVTHMLSADGGIVELDDAT